MKRIASGAEMQKIDAYSIRNIGIPGLVLMEKAALSMEEEILARFDKKTSILIVVERGNNGGDGLALGRLLMARGYPVTIYEIGGVPKASDSYLTQYSILHELGIPVRDTLPEDHFDVIIDGIFGVGLSREVCGIQREVIGKLNARDAFRVAVDVPSGVDAGTGKILGTAFRADLTITFGLLKIGLVLYPGAACCGEVVVKDIGFPEKAVETVLPSAFTYESSDLCRLPGRKEWSNKGSYGKVLIVAGAKNMAGAAALCSEAAYRTGSGLVRIFTAEENRVILQNLVPEAVMTTYQHEPEALDKLEEALGWATVIGFGCGLGQSSLTEKMLKLVLKKGRAPLVLDADGLNVLARMRSGKDPESLEAVSAFAEYSHGMILTPHLAEMSRLCGKTVDEIRGSLITTAEDMADERHVYVLKDARTIVSAGDGLTYINSSGNNGMSTGGSGDVLTGIICGLLAGGCSPDEAARLGVYCHGLAGDKAAEEKGHFALLARDLIEMLGRVLP